MSGRCFRRSGPNSPFFVSHPRRGSGSAPWASSPFSSSDPALGTPLQPNFGGLRPLWRRSRTAHTFGTRRGLVPHPFPPTVGWWSRRDALFRRLSPAEPVSDEMFSAEKFTRHGVPSPRGRSRGGPSVHSGGRSTYHSSAAGTRLSENYLLLTPLSSKNELSPGPGERVGNNLSPTRHRSGWKLLTICPPLHAR